MKPDIQPVDRQELPHLMEPLLISQESRHRPAIADLAVELAQRSASFLSSLPPSVMESLSALVRSMNCYYSNLIEGHDTHPIDIERALRNDYSNDTRKRDLQLEARAHIAVQQWIDEGGLAGGKAVTQAGIREIHRRFCELLPAELLWSEDPSTGAREHVVAGEFRLCAVQVGRHVPVSAGALPRFLERFEQVYAKLGKAEAIISSAAAHHRLSWIHPFLDGNGRVARLMSHAMLLESLGTGGVWSIARGLARNVDRYKSLLAECDEPRRNDLDGRGTLSEAALVRFTEFFLKTCIDQVEFMESLVRPDRLRDRVLTWAQEEIRRNALPTHANAVLEAILLRGELTRGDVPIATGTGERQARRIIAEMIERGVVRSANHLAPLRLAFPATLASRWMPGLFPDLPSDG